MHFHIRPARQSEVSQSSSPTPATEGQQSALAYKCPHCGQVSLPHPREIEVGDRFGRVKDAAIGAALTCILSGISVYGIHTEKDVLAVIAGVAAYISAAVVWFRYRRSKR